MKRSIMTRSLSACAALFRIRTAESIQYRAAAWAGASISIFWAIIELTVYSVFYQYGDTRGSAAMTMAQMASYVWLQQMFWVMMRMSVDSDILTTITNGNVGVELCRPLDLYIHWFSKTAAGSLGSAWWRAIITMIAGLLMRGAYHMGGPASAAGFVLFLCSMVTAFMLSMSYAMLVTVVRMGVTWGEGPTYILYLISGVLSGGYLPLAMWPDALQGFLKWQPFAGFIDLPFRLYLGITPPSEAAGIIAIQLLWMAAFITAGRALMRRKLRTIIVQGG